MTDRTDQMIEKDNEFHRALFRASGNSYLNEMVDYLSMKVHMVKFNAWSLPNRIEQSILEHNAMIAALERRDGEAFERLVTDHLLFSKNNYLEQLNGMPRTGISNKVGKTVLDRACIDARIDHKFLYEWNESRS